MASRRLTEDELVSLFLREPPEEVPDWGDYGRANSVSDDAISPESVDSFTPLSDQWLPTYAIPGFAELGYPDSPNDEFAAEGISPVPMSIMHPADCLIVDSPVLEYNQDDPVQRF